VIIHIYDKYPLPEYRKAIQKTVDEAIIEQVAKHQTVGPSKTAVQKKDLKDMGVQARLKALTSRGVFNVATRISTELRGIKQKELEASEANITKAAAQRRIILQDFEEPAVTSLTHWIYCGGKLIYKNAEQL
jgi:hypothetical protein